MLDHRLPKSYDYPRSSRALPAPFIQIRLLKLLGLLAAGDEALSERLYPVLVDVLRKGDNGTMMGHALVYETVKTAAAIVPNPKLIEASRRGV